MFKFKKPMSPRFLGDEVAAQVFYCAECDHRLVSSDDPKTGVFYEATGHMIVWSGIHRSKKLETGAEETVIFALCWVCDREAE